MSWFFLWLLSFNIFAHLMNVFLCVAWTLETAEKLIGRTDLCCHNQGRWSVWSCNQYFQTVEKTAELLIMFAVAFACVTTEALWTLPHTVKVLDSVCSFPADRSITCSYTFDWWELQCCGSHGKNTLFILHFLQIRRQFDLYRPPRCFSPARSNWERILALCTPQAKNCARVLAENQRKAG